MKPEEFMWKEKENGWCDGCGLYSIFNAICNALSELKLTRKDLFVVSGIGCAGRSAGYFAINSVQTLHGRTIPVALGIKTIKPNSNVLVFSGDGDLLAIGLNHLLHAARRGDNIKVFCSDNEVYAMTGGQKAPTTPIGRITSTSPQGNTERPINIQKLMLAHDNFFARTTTAHFDHLKMCIKEAIKYKGFAYVDIKSACPTNTGRAMKMSLADMIRFYQTNYKIKQGKSKTLKENELGIIK